MRDTPQKSGKTPGALLATLAANLKAGKYTKVVFMVGAGISTSAGIPDFRTPGTGLYSNLSKLDLPFAEAVFDIDYFRQSPKAFYTLAGELYPGKFRPTPFHYFLRLLDAKGFLKRVYTQNIDTLERLAGVRADAIVEAHGSFAANHCIDCHAELLTALLRLDMDDDEVDGIPVCRECGGYVKPDIVFFGESLPERFHTLWEQDQTETDLIILAGTSLSVYPFAGLPSDVPQAVPRVLINQEAVGDFAERPRKADVLALQACDAAAAELAALCGWSNELAALMAKGQAEFDATRAVAGVDVAVNDGGGKDKTLATEAEKDGDASDVAELSEVESLKKEVESLKATVKRLEAEVALLKADRAKPAASNPSAKDDVSTLIKDISGLQLAVEK